MAFIHLDLTVTDAGVATLLLNRPDKVNAVNVDMRNELIDAFAQTDRDDDVKAVIVTGAGRGFCAGADLSAGGKTFHYGTEEERSRHRDGGGRITLRMYDSLKPVIAAVNGPAVGFGATFTLAADVRIMADHAFFSFPFVKRGIVPDACSTWFLPRIVGISRAAQWTYSGARIGADEARGCGLVSEVLAAEDLLERAHVLALELVEGSAPVSIAHTRRLLWHGLAAPDPHSAHLAESRALASRGASLDAREGVEAYVARRPPVFPDKVSEQRGLQA